MLAIFKPSKFSLRDIAKSTAFRDLENAKHFPGIAEFSAKAEKLRVSEAKRDDFASRACKSFERCEMTSNIQSDTMPSDDYRPSERKVAALLLIAVVAGAIGLYSYSQEHPETAGSIKNIASGIRFPTGFSLFSARAQSLTFDAELEFDVKPEVALEVSEPAEALLLSLESGNSVSIGGTSWKYPLKTAVEAGNFTGKITLSDAVSVSGNAKKVAVNSAGESSSDTGIIIQASDLKVSSAELKGVSGIEVNLKNITGTIKASDGKNSAIYKVLNNQLLITAYSGDVYFSGKKIMLKGAGKLTGDLLNAKSG